VGLEFQICAIHYSFLNETQFTLFCVASNALKIMKWSANQEKNYSFFETDCLIFGSKSNFYRLFESKNVVNKAAQMRKE